MPDAKAGDRCPMDHGDAPELIVYAMAASGPTGATVDPLIYALLAEVARQDDKHGPFEGTILGRSRLALACLEDEVDEATVAWRSERTALNWTATRGEVLQVAAVAVRTLRDAL